MGNSEKWLCVCMFCFCFGGQKGGGGPFIAVVPLLHGSEVTAHLIGRKIPRTS